LPAARQQIFEFLLVFGKDVIRSLRDVIL